MVYRLAAERDTVLCRQLASGLNGRGRGISQRL